MISNAETAREAEALGRSVQLRADWEAVKYDIMVDILRAKFSPENPRPYSTLLDTGDEYLVKDNTWHDNIWGDYHCIRCAGQQGQNLLRLALMQVRDEISSNGI